MAYGSGPPSGPPAIPSSPPPMPQSTVAQPAGPPPVPYPPVPAYQAHHSQQGVAPPPVPRATSAGMPVWDPAAGRPGPYGRAPGFGDFPVYGPQLPPVPRPRPASAATWALATGIVAVALAPCLGGAIPGLIALALARMAAAEVASSEGWLTGAGMIRAARVLSLVAISIAVVVGTALAVSWLVGLGVTAHDPHYPSNVN
jgi:hydroxylaminobenzene mutase